MPNHLSPDETPWIYEGDISLGRGLFVLCFALAYFGGMLWLLGYVL